MATRLSLQTKLEDMLGSRSVYFQPPESIQIVYPAIVYKLDDKDVKHADDDKYLITNRYFIQYIHPDPDDTLTDDILRLRYCSFIGRTVVDGLYHDNYNLFY